MRQKDISVRQISRGGKWTYHGPGQVLIYPIARLQSLGLGVRAVRPFLSALKSGVVRYLEEINIPADSRPNKPFGLYGVNGKLASFGIRLERGICTHGLALYLSDQRPLFEGIHACGVRHEEFSSLAQCGKPLPWETVARRLAKHVRDSLSEIETT